MDIERQGDVSGVSVTVKQRDDGTWARVWLRCWNDVCRFLRLAWRIYMSR